jgi:hypothetical protein
MSDNVKPEPSCGGFAKPNQTKPKPNQNQTKPKPNQNQTKTSLG